MEWLDLRVPRVVGELEKALQDVREARGPAGVCGCGRHGPTGLHVLGYTACSPVGCPGCRWSGWGYSFWSPADSNARMHEEWQQSGRGKGGDGCPEFNSHGLRGLRGYLKPCGVLTDGGLATRAGACQHPALDSASTSVYKLGLGASAASPPKARHHHHGLLERRRPLA